MFSKRYCTCIYNATQFAFPKLTFPQIVCSVLQTYTTTTTTILQPFFRDHPGELVPEEKFWTLWCKGRLTEADTLTIWLGTTPSGLTSAHLYHPPYFFTGQMPFLPPNQQRQSTEGRVIFKWILFQQYHNVSSLDQTDVGDEDDFSLGCTRNEINFKKCHMTDTFESIHVKPGSSVLAEDPHNVLYHLKSSQLPHNCMKNCIRKSLQGQQKWCDT